jgi:hypothetical protein
MVCRFENGKVSPPVTYLDGQDVEAWRVISKQILLRQYRSVLDTRKQI